MELCVVFEGFCLWNVCIKNNKISDFNWEDLQLFPTALPGNAQDQMQATTYQHQDSIKAHLVVIHLFLTYHLSFTSCTFSKLGDF